MPPSPRSHLFVLSTEFCNALGSGGLESGARRVCRGNFFPLRLRQELTVGAKVAAVKPSSFFKAKRSLPVAANHDTHLRPHAGGVSSRLEAALEPGPVKSVVSCGLSRVRGPSQPAEPSPAGDTKMQRPLGELTLQDGGQPRTQMPSPQGPRLRPSGGAELGAQGFGRGPHEGATLAGSRLGLPGRPAPSGSGTQEGLDTSDGTGRRRSWA